MNKSAQRKEKTYIELSVPETCPDDIPLLKLHIRQARTLGDVSIDSSFAPQSLELWVETYMAISVQEH